MAVVQLSHFIFMKYKASNYLNNHLFHINYPPKISQLEKGLLLQYIMPPLFVLLVVNSFHATFDLEAGQLIYTKTYFLQ